MILNRYKNNPILTKEDVPFRVNSIFNAGAIKYGGKYLLICRAELPSGRSCFVKAVSSDGVKFFVESRPFLTAEDHKQFYKYCEWGIEDVRVTKLEDRYILTYTGYSQYMPLVMLAETWDFESVKIVGPISLPSNKDCAIFPEKINGFYWKMDRPAADNRKDIWLSKSTDLRFWGDPQFLTAPLAGSWEANKIGNSTPAIRTKDGWLFLYHGVRGFEINSIYKLGAMLLDIDDPSKVIGRTKGPILSPDLDYERSGDVPNVVFCNGWILEDDNSLKIYYSGADTNICLAETTLDELLEACK